MEVLGTLYERLRDLQCGFRGHNCEYRFVVWQITEKGQYSKLTPYQSYRT